MGGGLGGGRWCVRSSLVPRAERGRGCSGVVERHSVHGAVAVAVGRGAGDVAGGGGEAREQIAKKSGGGNRNSTPHRDNKSIPPSGAVASNAIEPKYPEYLTLTFGPG